MKILVTFPKGGARKARRVAGRKNITVKPGISPESFIVLNLGSVKRLEEALKPHRVVVAHTQLTD